MNNEIKTLQRYMGLQKNVLEQIVALFHVELIKWHIRWNCTRLGAVGHETHGKAWCKRGHYLHLLEYSGISKLL